jgi:hypothetical protein
MQNLMNAGWNGVRYGAGLSVKNKSVNSVTLAINRLPEAGKLKLFQRIDDGGAVEIMEGQITLETKEVTVNNLEQGKAYYFKLQIEWGEGNYNYSPEVGVVLGAKSMLVDNGGFSSDLNSGWIVRQNNGASITTNIIDGKLHASVSSLGENFWDLGFLNTKTSSFFNQNVIISFWAKADKNADIRFTLDFDNKKYPTQSVTTTWQQYKLKFDNVSSGAFQFKMWLASNAEYEIDDIEVYYGSVPSIELKPEGGEGSTINLNAQNLIINPGFENGLTGWVTQHNNGSDVSFLIETINTPEGDNHFKCEVNTLGTNDWDVQLRSNEFVVDESHQYRLTFKAKSKKPGSAIKIYWYRRISRC